MKKKSNQKNNSGMTLVELMVVSAVTVLILGVLSVLLIKVFYINRYSFEQGMNTFSLRSSLKNVSDNLREAKQSDAGDYLISKADGNSVVFYANIDKDSATERVRYFLEGTQLKMGIAKASGFPLRYPASDQEIKVVASGIANQTNQPFFYYFNKNYSSSETVGPLGSPVPIENIYLIKIDIYANVNPLKLPNSMQMETFVRPRNIQ